MIDSPYFISCFESTAHILLEIAVEFRNTLIFRGCLVWVVSPWSKREVLRTEIKVPKFKITFNVYHHVKKRLQIFSIPLRFSLQSAHEMTPLHIVSSLKISKMSLEMRLRDHVLIVRANCSPAEVLLYPPGERRVLVY